MLIAFNGVNSDTMTLPNYITVFPTPPPQGILQSGDTLFANQGAVSYQWYSNGILIQGATDYFYVAPESGNYNVVATDVNGCEVEAVIFDVVASTSPLTLGEGSEVMLFPNPVVDNLEIRNLTAGIKLTIIIYNNLGEKVFEQKDMIATPHLSIGMKAFPSGIYHLELSGEKTSERKIFTKL
jgi:hypothetical protein